MTPNRSPSPLSSRNFRNSEVNSTSRKSFNGNPFSRPNSLINPKSSDPFTPANTPTATDHTKRNPITRKSIGGGSMFQDGKENRKDAFRSPAKTASKNFMSPTISAASKFTPSPRKKILGERNEGTLRASIGFSNNDESVIEPGIDEQKEESVVENPCVDEVNLMSSTNDDSGFGNIVRPLCCSPITDSPIVPVTDSDPNLPPYDPKKNFLSPRPQFLRYKPNPRIEFLLNKEENNDYGEDDVTRLEDTFNLSDNSSDTEDKEPEKEDSFNLSDNSLEEKEPEKEGELGDDSVHGTESVLDENPFDLKVDKASKPRFFTVSKAVLFVFVLFLVACFSLSFTESPPVDLPIYEDIGFSEIYLGSLRFVAFAKESFDDLVENVRQWVIDQNSHYFPTHNIGSIQFFNLTTSPIQEEFQFNRHIGTDYIQEIQEFQEFQEEDTEVVDNESEIDEVVAEEPIYEQILSEIDESVTKEPINDQIQNEIVDIVETKSNPDEVQSEMVENVEIESSVADINEESEASGALSTQSIATICVAGVSMVVMAVATVFYMNQKKSIACVNDDSAHEESGSSERSSNMQKGYKKKTNNNKRESLASSSSEFSMSDSFGSFTTFERIAIKHKDEVMLTPIRRSSRLLKNQAISS